MRKLRKSEVNRIIKENSALSNEDLVNKFFGIVYNDVLGSQAGRMEDAGWDESDVKERREYEDYMDWNSPTPEQIKNLKEILNIDVKLIGEDDD